MRMDDRSLRVLPPILRNKHYDLASAFTPESLLREARRQKDVPNTPVPEICVLDPDGDIVRHLRAGTGRTWWLGWACYHSTMDQFDQGGRKVGIVELRSRSISTPYWWPSSYLPPVATCFSAPPRQARSQPWVHRPTSS